VSVHGRTAVEGDPERRRITLTTLRGPWRGCRVRCWQTATFKHSVHKSEEVLALTKARGLMIGRGRDPVGIRGRSSRSASFAGGLGVPAYGA